MQALATLVRGTACDLAAKSDLYRIGHSGSRHFELLGQRSWQSEHCLGTQQGNELLFIKQAPQRIDDKNQPGLRQIGLLTNSFCRCASCW